MLPSLDINVPWCLNPHFLSTETREGCCLHFVCSSSVPRGHSLVWRSFCKVMAWSYLTRLLLNVWGPNVKPFLSYPLAGDCPSTLIYIRTRLRSGRPDLLLR